MTSHRRTRIARHTSVEALLQRVLLSVSVVKETLTVEGTAGKDVISLSVVFGSANQMSVKVNGEERLFRLGRFKVININALGGNDAVRIGDLNSDHPAYLNIDLGSGNDRADGSSGAERIVGGNGNDRIAAGAGSDYVNAGNGDDVITGDAGRDTLIGLAGKDSIYGGDGNDSLFGGDEDDSLDGTAGDDTINGGNGNDRIIENDPAVRSKEPYRDKRDFKNLIDGSRGDDYIEIRGYGGLSQVYGGDGNDYLIGHNLMTQTFWMPTLFGGAGDDKLIGTHASGGSGNDKMVASRAFFGSVKLNGDEGDDAITSKIPSMFGSIKGGDGNDTIHNSTIGLDTLDGGNGNDFIETGSELATGGAGNDTIRAGHNDTSYSSAGYWKGKPPMYSINGEGTSGDVYQEFGSRRFHGGPGDDLIYGGGQGDTLEGEAGDDTLYGGHGKDVFVGGDGADSFYGGESDSNQNSSLASAKYVVIRDNRDRFDRDHEWITVDSVPAFPPPGSGSGVIVSPNGYGSIVIDR